MSRRKIVLIKVFAISSLLVIFQSSWGFEIDGTKWRGAETAIYVAIPGTSGSGITWEDSLRDAMNEWSEKTDFTFIPIQQYRDPCTGYRRNLFDDDFPLGDGDNLNSVDFTPSICGNRFGNSTLAVTLIFSEVSDLGLGTFDLLQTDILLNANESFDIYDLPHKLGLFDFRAIDFRRVVLHELGHVAGLSHESIKPSIMSPSIGNTTSLQDDDIAGINALYGGLGNCKILHPRFGRSTNSLSAGDCRAQELVVGGSDDSYIDVYQFDFDEEIRLNFEMTSSSLDSVLILADSELNFLALDDNSGGGCDAQITVTLPAGRYYLMANTYSGSSSCGDITGPYELTIGYVQTKLLTLKVEEDDNSNIRFTGGITADNGLTFGNRFLSTDSLDISVNIDVNPDHVGQPGFIIVFAELQGGQTLFKNEQGDFVVLDPQRSQLPIATRKTLERIEKVNIIENLVAADLDIDNIEVDFFVGYSLQSNFLELFSHTEPINLIIEP